MTGVFATSIVFEPTDEQLSSITNQLLVAGGGRSSAIFDNSNTRLAQGRTRAACAAAGVTYLGGGGNLGTGEGLNSLLRAATDEWLLYLDQDSILEGPFLEILTEALKAAGSFQAVVAVGSRIVLRSDTDPAGTAALSIAPVRFLIASGTTYNVFRASSLGGFDGNLFLDTVDHEFCLRARKAGMTLLQDPRLVLSHEIGSDSVRVLGMSRLRVARHPVWRRQLMWRNTVILVRRYLRIFPLDCIRHLSARIVDTLLGAVVYRDAGFLTSALRGIGAGFESNDAGPVPLAKHR